MILFCSKCYRFACNTCPFIHKINGKMKNRKYKIKIVSLFIISKLTLYSYCKLKEIDDVLGGAAAWENVQQTDET